MYRLIILSFFFCAAALWLPAQSSCFTKFMDEGKRLEGRRNYDGAIDQYLAANKCPGQLSNAQKEQIERAVKNAQERKLRQVENALAEARAAKTEADKARALAEAASAEAAAQAALAQKEQRITEANSLAFRADQALKQGDSLVALHMAFRARRNTENDEATTESVKLSFGQAVLAYYGQRVGKVPAISLAGSISPDGQYVAFPGKDHAIALWRLSGESLLPVPVSSGHGGPVRALAFSPNNTYWASGSEDGTVIIWDLMGSSLRRLGGHTGEVSGLTFSPQGDQLLSWSTDGTARLWDVSLGTSTPLSGQRGQILSAAFSPDGSSILTRSSDRSVMIWDQNGNPLAAPVTHPGYVFNASFAPDGLSVLTSSVANTARLFTIPSQQVNDLNQPDRRGITTAAVFSRDGRFLITGGEDMQVRVFSLDGRLIDSFQPYGSAITDIGFSPGADYFYTASQVGGVRLWRLNAETGMVANKSAPVQLGGQSGAALQTTFSPNGQQLIMTAADRSVKMWDLKGDLLLDYRHPASSGGEVQSGLIAADFSASGNAMLIRSPESPPLLVPNPMFAYEALKTGSRTLAPVSDDLRRVYGLEETPSVEVGPDVGPEVVGTYRIQLAALADPSGFDTAKAGDFGPVEEVKTDRLTRIFVGGFATRADAERVLPQIRAGGYRGAFIVSPRLDESPTVNTPMPDISSTPSGQEGTADKPVPTAPAAAGPYKIQLAALGKPEGFEQHRAKIAPLGRIEAIPGDVLTRFYLSDLATEADARRLLPRVQAAGFPGAYIVVWRNGALDRVR